MKHTAPLHSGLSFCARMFALAVFALANMPLRADPPPPSGNIVADTVIDPVDRVQITAASPIAYNIYDGVTLTLRNGSSTANGGVFLAGGNLTIGPSGTLGTGRVIFENNQTSGQGGVLYVNSGRSVNITNSIFRNNASSNNSGAGVIRNDSNAGSINLSRVLFEGNSAQIGAVIRNYAAGGVFVTTGTFLGNYTSGTSSSAGMGGAIQVGSATAETNLVDVAFIANRAGRDGGAIMNSGNAGVVLRDMQEFTGNWGGRSGGAIYDNNNAVTSGNSVEFIYSGSTGKDDFVYSGNVAGGLGAIVPEATLVSGTYTMTPLARSGGFYYANNAGWLRFNIAGTVTLSIGQAGNPAAFDSIATANAGTGAKLDKAGAGRLILHADNAYFQGTVNVNEGSLLLGNQDARLGGVINVATGATFGGAGTLTTLNQSNAVVAGRTIVSTSAGAFIQTGNPTAVDAETLTVGGDLVAGAGITFSHDLFTSGSASLLRVANLSLAGTGTVNLGLLATGSFALIEWTGSGLGAGDLSQLILTVDGVASNPRSTAALSLSGNQLVVTNTVNNLIMRWTGAEGASWTRRPSTAQKNWTDAGGSSENRFFNADSVVFDGVADAANAENRDITIDAGGVVVSGMEVTGTARYVFGGAGGIEADAGAVGSAAFAPSGKLKKSGAGELAFVNTGSNLFQGGIEIAGGVLAFDHAGQLGSGTGGIAFVDSATLRAAGTVTGTLTGGINIAAGKTAGVEVEQAGALVYAGALTSAADSTLRKTGEGALLLTGDSSANTGTVALEAGALTLATPGAALGGKITVGSGATLGGVGTTGGSVKLAAGGILEAGLDTTQSGTLTVNNLEMTGEAMVRMDLFKDADTGGYQKSDRIIDTGASVISGTNTIDLTSFASGTFNLGNLTGLAAAGRVTLSGMTLPSGGRLTAELTNSSGVLKLVTTSDQSREMTWTGSSGSTWNLAQANWTGAGAVNQFSYGDRVRFDGTGAAGSRDIFIDAGEVRVADMTVGGAGNYTFTGGGIHADADNVQPDAGGVEHITDATGKLIKMSGGTLTLANAKNTFLGGVEISGGVLAISRGDQLTTSATTGIEFTGAGTLRANADLALDNTITIAAGVTGVFDSFGHTVALDGVIIGAADATLAKTGAGVVVLGADISGFSGTLAVGGGVLRAGAADVLTAASAATISVDAGAVIDLDGHNQTLSKLRGAGTVELGAAKLVMDIDAGGAGFGGGFAGSGTVFKQGAGKWTLSGSSSHTGGMVLQDGELGLANSFALGAGALSVEAPAAKLYIEADGLTIANYIVAGANGVTISAGSGYRAEFSGSISGGAVTLEGSGTLVLSGNNSNAGLTIKNARTVARRAESISGAVTIDTGSVLEFDHVPGGQINSVVSGDTLMFASSTLAMRGANTLQKFIVGAGSFVTADTVGSLGGAGVDVTVRDGGQLKISNTATLARNMNVDGGAIIFGSNYKMSSLELSGTMNFINGGEIKLGGILPTGVYTAAIAAGGIPDMPAYDPHQGGMFMVVDVVDGGTLLITAYNKALEPGKDIVVSFDAMAASMRTVYSRVSEEFLTPLLDHDAQKPKKSLWFRMIGTFGDQGDDADHLGYTDKTYAGIVGYDWISGKNLMLGGYIGHATTRLETTNNATTDMNMPYMGLYAARRMGDFYIAGDFTKGFGGADTERREDQGNVVKGSYDLGSIGGSLEFGYMLPLFANGGIKPSIGIHYMGLSFKDYAETGKGAVRLDDIRASLLQGVVRIDASRKLTMPWGLPGMVDVRVAWSRNLDNQRTDTWATLVDYPNARFQIRGDEYDSNGVIMGIGLRMMLSRKILFSLMYDSDRIPLGGHDKVGARHTFSSMIRVSW